jgi:hypothetical protein
MIAEQGDNAPTILCFTESQTVCDEDYEYAINFLEQCGDGDYTTSRVGRLHHDTPADVHRHHYKETFQEGKGTTKFLFQARRKIKTCQYQPYCTSVDLPPTGSTDIQAAEKATILGVPAVISSAS